MRRVSETWTIADLRDRFRRINFPEYQRESTVWSLSAKQKLVDSILRQFDVGTIFLYDNGDGSFDCVDGRQRINAIMSFFGENPGDPDNAYECRISNEVYEDNELEARLWDHRTWEAVTSDDTEPVQRLRGAFENYRAGVVILSDVLRAEEFNLQFIRLNLGALINAGEKLHAMIGELRDVCFAPGPLHAHPFLELVSIPTRRFAKEQVVAQVVAQVFSKDATGDYMRTRHFDLQRVFKENVTLNQRRRDLVDEVRRTFDSMLLAFGQATAFMRNRAVVVTAVLLAWECGLYKAGQPIERFAEFFVEFSRRLRWQVRKGRQSDPEYLYLIEFQRHVSQASVEKPALDGRLTVMRTEWERFRLGNRIRGDEEYTARTGSDPAVESLNV